MFRLFLPAYLSNSDTPKSVEAIFGWVPWEGTLLLRGDGGVLGVRP
jgi:hypothetical protein